MDQEQQNDVPTTPGDNASQVVGQNETCGQENGQVKTTPVDGERSRGRSRVKSSRRSRKRRRSPSSSSSSSHDSASDSFSTDDERENREPKLKRFKIVSEEDKSKYDLPRSMAEYANEHSECYIAEKDLKEGVLLDNPVPTNIDPVKKLDDFVRGIIKDSHHSKSSHDLVEGDNVLEKIQSRVRDVMGPLSRLWSMIEKATKSEKQEVNLSIDDLQELVEQTVVMVGQCSNTITYHRRFAVLKNLMGIQQAKETLREKASLLQKHDKQLLGEKFRSHIVEVTKSKNTTMEAFSKSKNSRRKAPFRNALPTNNQGRSGAGRQITLSRGGQKPYQRWWHQGKQHQQKQDGFYRQKGKFSSRKQPTYSQHLSGFDTSSGERSQTSSSNNKTVVLKRNTTQCASGRQIKVLSGGVEKNFRRSRNIIFNRRLQDTHVERACPEYSSSASFSKWGTTATSSNRNPRNVEKRCNMQGSSRGGRIHKQFVPSRKERRRSETCDKSKKSEPVCTLQSLQNGRFTVDTSHVTAGRLHVQVRSEGCLFLHTSSPRIPEICKISMGRGSLPIFVPVFWLRASTSSFYQVAQGTNECSEETRHVDHNIYRRYVDYWSYASGNSFSQRHSDLPFSTSRLSIQPQKICVRPFSGDRVFRINNRFSEDDVVIDQGESCESSEILRNTLQDGFSVDFRIDEGARSVSFFNSGCVTSTVTVSPFATSTNTSFEIKKVISSQGKIEPFCQRGVDVVDREPEVFQWENIASTKHKSSSDPDGCLNERVGGSLSRYQDRGPLVIRGTEISYKCVRTTSYQAGTTVISQNPQTQVHSFSSRQQNCPLIPFKNGRDKEQDHDQDNKRDLGDFVGREHNYFRRVSSRCLEPDSRLGVSESQRLLRLETVSSTIPENNKFLGGSINRSVCITSVSSTQELYVVAARSVEQSSGCNATGLVTKSPRAYPVCIPSFLSNTESSEQGIKRQGSSDDSHCSNLAVTGLVPQTITNDSRRTINATTIPKSSSKFKSRKSSFSSKQDIKIRGVENFKQSLVDSGLSESAASLISNSRRQSSNANYDSSWKKFASWCCSRQVDPVSCPVNSVLDFLAHLFDEGYQYRTINCYRSSISAYHQRVERVPIGQHPQVCALLKGVFNKKPPQPKYGFTWKVQTVLDYIKNHWAVSEDLSDKELTYKLVILLALTSTSRACTIHCLDLKFMANHGHYVQFQFGKLHKGWRSSKGSPTVKYFEYKQDQALCVVHTLQVYIKQCKKWRDEGQTQLLLSYINPHQGVCSSTISRWIKEVLKISGINTEIFKAHSSRSASSTGASLAGASVSEILKMGSWSRESTWQRFYNKPVVSPEESFQGKILSLK